VKTIIVGILGAIKLLLQSFGIDVLDDNLINGIVNAVLAIVAVVAMVRDNIARYKAKKAAKAAA
jgi:uncharacterized membrane protein